MGQKQANAFGLYDMHGNLWEWVQDVWHDNKNGVPTDGSAREAEEHWLDRLARWFGNDLAYYRVLRGGSWGDIPGFLRSACRFRKSPDYRSINFGFRLARTVP